ncbi:hypothetical protein RHGRI_011412 [Rhododendron griersonianum]|uniref:GH16 domain-containing protein n=1 Tax=Rhododendron griersonianum TaxID=479676 RepID=A0AAV6KLV2_9ERIC|nr:hypothetical protein RHGRI_011412 [Rhododendron griersonianum]
MVWHRLWWSSVVFANAEPTRFRLLWWSPEVEAEAPPVLLVVGGVSTVKAFRVKDEVEGVRVLKMSPDCIGRVAPKEMMWPRPLRFDRDIEFYWGSENANVLSGKSLTMSLYNSSSCGFRSYDGFLFGRFDMHIKLVPGNSAGIVTTYYVSCTFPHYYQFVFLSISQQSC